MKIIISLVLIFFGILIVFITYRDGKKRNAELTTSYIMHLKGYVGGVVLILIGVIMMFKVH